MKMLQHIFPLILLIFLAGVPLVQGQPLSLIGTGGNMVNADNVYLSYSFGEPLSVYHIHTAALLTEGFQQPEAIDLTTGNIELSAPASFRLSPNPAADVIRLEWSEEWNCKRIRIENYSGHTLIDNIHQDSHERELQVNQLSPGLYFLRLTNTDNREFIHSFIKI